MKESGTPPRLAEAIISLLAAGPTGAGMLGDLSEEFRGRWMRSPRAANRWYWGQVLRSAPYLAGMRLRRSPLPHLLVIMLSTAIALALLHIWDVQVSRRLARLLALQPNTPPLLLIRALYFFSLTIGTALVGALLAITAFRPKRSFVSNTIACILPAFLVLTGLSYVSNIAAAEQSRVIYFALRSCIILPALLLGAHLAVQASPPRIADNH